MGEWTRKILVVDDEPLVGALVTSVLEQHGFLVKTATSAGDARQVAEGFDPDLAIVDVNLGDGPTGIQLGYVLTQLNPGIAIVYFTNYPTALLTGARGMELSEGAHILAKDDVEDAGKLISIIEQALVGKSPQHSPSGEEDIKSLTATQLSILSMVAAGHTNASIAKKRDTSDRAVEKHLKLIYQSLGLVVNHDTNARVLAARRYAEVMGETPNDEAQAI